MENIDPGDRSDKHLNLDPAKMLISPPPEDELRLPKSPVEGMQTKRKRQSIAPNPSTPNPKPKKLARTPSRSPSPPRRSRSPYPPVLVQSPHASNPLANFVPVDEPPRRRRGTTPVVPYEPPQDIFTPPREVIVVRPSQTPTPRRRGKSRQHKKPTFATIKLEPPVINLSADYSPPSPTDDILLLTDPAVPKPSSSRGRRKSPSPAQPVASTSYRIPATPERQNAELAAPAEIDPNQPVHDGWSDDDDDDNRDVMMEGDFTGKFKEVIIPTKTDPPSSATRHRMEEWGRPKSPHPNGRRFSSIREADDDVDDDQEPIGPAPFPEVPETDSDGEDDEPGNKELPIADYSDEEADSQAAPPEGSRPEPSSALVDSNLTPLDPTAADLEEEEEVREMSIEPAEANPSANRPQHVDDAERHALNTRMEAEELDEEEEVRAMSVEREQPDDDGSDADKQPATPRPLLKVLSNTDTLVGEEGGEGDSDDEDDDEDPLFDLDMIKITSTNPTAAARAVAILKQHNYDTYTTQRLHKEKFYRRRTLDGGIQKRHSVTPDRRNRRTLAGGVLGNQVFLPGSPVATTIDDVLQRADSDVREQSICLESPAPSPVVRAKSTPGEWTRDDWKVMDMCFTDERYELGGGDTMADVDHVDAERVVARFRCVDSYEWPQDELEQRVMAIAKKQRSGNVAPPLTPRSTPEPRNIFDVRQATMTAPDFSPLGRRAMPPGRNNRATGLPPPLPEPLQNAPFQDLDGMVGKVPSVLFGPRYSHLLEEAQAISKPKAALPDIQPKEEEQDADTSGETSFGDSSFETSFESKDTADPMPFRTPAPRRASLGGRVKSFFFSYLPTAPKTAPAPRKLAGGPNYLPPPPPQGPRGPIDTPVKAPEPKAPPPKDLVDLNHIATPAPKSMIPKKKPKRLVELQHVSPEKGSVQEPSGRLRRSSSVKDMVQDFEHLSKSQQGRMIAAGTAPVKPPGKLKETKRPIWR